MSNIISNLASSTPRIFAFKDSDLILKLRFPDNYPLSGLSSKIYYNGRFREGIATTTYSGSLATIKITKENIALIPLSVFTLFIYNGGTVLTYTIIEVKFTGNNNVNDTINVTISDGIDIELSFIDIGSSLEYSELAQQAAIEAQNILDQIQAIDDLNVTVNTYNDAVPLFTGSDYKRIDVISDTNYNEGNPSFYTYNPLLPSGKRVAFLGLDPDYLTN